MLAGVASFFLAFVDGFMVPSQYRFFSFLSLDSSIIPFSFVLFLLETGAKSISSCIELLVALLVVPLGS